jgi:hypothetical protein
VSTITVGIVGTRRRNTQKDLEYLLRFVEIIVKEYSDDRWDIRFVSGGCKLGADRFAEIIAEGYGIPITIHYPNQADLPDEPKTWDYRVINFARNTLIAEDADILVAMVAPDRKGGTEDTIEKFCKLHSKGKLFII